MARAGAGWRGNRELADTRSRIGTARLFPTLWRPAAHWAYRIDGPHSQRQCLSREAAAYPLPSGDAPAGMRFTNSEINQVVTRGLPCGGKNRRQEEFMKIRIAFAALLLLGLCSAVSVR